MDEPGPGTGEERRANASTASVSVCVGIKSWVGGAPYQAWLGEFEIPEAELVDLRREVEDLARQSRDLPPLPYDVRETRGRTSWGADSGEFIRIVLWLGGEAVSDLIAAAVVALFSRLARRERRSRGTVKMSRSEAVERARWVLTRHYGHEAKEYMDRVPTDDSELTVIGDKYSAETNSWTILFQDADRTKYKVKLGHVEGLPVVSEIARLRGEED